MKFKNKNIIEKKKMLFPDQKEFLREGDGSFTS